MMSSRQVIAELEEAAKILLAPPEVTTPQQRQQCEQVFMNFRKTKSPFTLCRTILDTSQSDYVLFEAVETLKNGLIREWSFLLTSYKTSLRQYLMQYVLSRPKLASFVRDKMLQLIAIIIKRISVDDEGKERSHLLVEIENLVLNGEVHKKILGFNILSNLLQQYASSVHSEDVGLFWEVNFKAKKQFEQSDLKRIFQFCVELLGDFVESDRPLEDTSIELTRHLLKVCETILSWGKISSILPKRLIGIYESAYESDLAPSLRADDDWAPIILAPEFLPLMFRVYWKVRNFEQLSLHATICLMQLASLNGSIVGDEETRVKYFTAYLDNFSKLLSTLTITRRESVDISNIVRKLVHFFVHDVHLLPKQIQETYLDEMSRLTCQLIRGAMLHESTDPDEENLFNDALDNMMIAWMTLIHENTMNFSNDILPPNEVMCKPNGNPAVYYHDLIRNNAISIFNTYVQAHLAPPNGFRMATDYTKLQELDDHNETDRNAYKEQLQVVGMFGRLAPEHSLPVIFRLLEMGIERLKGVFRELECSGKRTLTTQESADVESLFEDIHWTVLITGHIIGMDTDGEASLLPSELVDYSHSKCNSKEFEVDASLATLANIRNMDFTPSDKCDHIIRIVADVLRLCHIESAAAQVQLALLLSPELSCTFMWCLRRWVLCHLQAKYGTKSPTLEIVNEKDSEVELFVLEFILEKVHSNICFFSTEAQLLKETTDLLYAVVRGRHINRSTSVAKSKNIWKLVELNDRLKPGNLPPGIRAALVRDLLTAARSFQDSNEHQEYVNRVLRTIEERLKIAFNQSPTTITDPVMHVADVVEFINGIAQGTQFCTVFELFEVIKPILAELPNLLATYSNYDLIVQMLLDTVSKCGQHILCYLPPSDSSIIYECAINMIQIYTKTHFHNQVSLSHLNGEKTESICLHLGLILDMLTTLLSKDYLGAYRDVIDLRAIAQSSNSSSMPVDDADTITSFNSVVPAKASDVSLFGLNFILPMFTMDLLNYPELCKKFYRLLVLTNELYPEKVSNLSITVYNQMLAAVRLGLTHFGPDIVSACLEFVTCSAMYFLLQCDPIAASTSEIYLALKPFVKLILDLILSHQISNNSMSNASMCLYALMCAYPEEYRMLVDQLILSQTDSLVANRLTVAFEKLTENIPLKGDRNARLKFRVNFDKFITNVHGFLLVK